MANKVTTVFDADAKGFRAGVSKMIADVRSADGITGKFKAGVSGMGSVLKDNIVGASVAAGAAVAAFATKSAQFFEQTALAAGKFAATTGTTVEQASRLNEVAGDLGINSDSLASAIQRMNNAIATGSVNFAKLGADIARTKDGNVDTYQSFLNVAAAIGSISDASQRENAARAAFGKGWSEIAEMVGMSADELKQRLGDVSDAKVINEDELQKAKDFRDAMDNLRDRMEDVQLEVGEAVVPALTDLVHAFDAVDNAAKAVFGPSGSFVGGIATAIESSGLMKIVNFVNDLNTAINGFPEESILPTVANGELAANFDVLGKLIPAIADDLSRVASSGDEAATSLTRIPEVTEAAARQSKNAAAAAQIFLNNLKDIPPEKMVQIRAAMSRGDLAAVQAVLDTLGKGITLPVRVKVTTSDPQAILGGAAKAVNDANASAVNLGNVISKAVSGGGGSGGGGGGKTAAKTAAEQWDDAMAKLYDYGELERDDYIKYLDMRMAGEDKFSDAYHEHFKQKQALEKEAADEKKKADDEEQKRLKEKQDAEEALAKYREKQAKEEADRQALLEGARQAALQIFGGGPRTVNVYTTNPEDTVKALQRYYRNNGKGNLP